MTRYTLQDAANIAFHGFDVEIPEETIKLIQELTSQVGSPTYVKTPTFPKKEEGSNNSSSSLQCNGSGNGIGAGSGTSAFGYKKKKPMNRGADFAKDGNWETLRTFHTTKIEQKVGIDAEIDIIRSYLNKMTDKNYSELKDQIISILDNLVDGGVGNENMLRVTNTIFDIASNNRFFSKLYADLYCVLMNKYDIMQQTFENSFNNFMELFSSIEYVDADKDYDKFCKVNKNNETRKSLSTFFVNLCNNDVLSVDKLMNLLQGMLEQVMTLRNEKNKKCQVDEFTENIYILYNKSILERVVHSNYMVNGMTVNETIQSLACCKSKDYLSLSNKAIFKYMDIVEKHGDTP
jgi:hypothetical protein